MKKISFLVCAAVVMMLVMVSSALAFTPAGLIQGIPTNTSITAYTDDNLSTSAVANTGQTITLEDVSTIRSMRVKASTSNIGIHFWDATGTYIGSPNGEDYVYLGDLNGGLYSITPVAGVKTIALYYIGDPSVTLYEIDVYSTTADTTAPATPTDLIAVAGDTQVSLSWDANTDIDLAGYNVYRDGVKINTSLITDESFVDTGLTNDIEYTYTITAVDTSDNESAESEEALATPTASSSEGRALIVITLDNGLEKEYDWSMDEVNDFIDWYDARAEGTGLTRYVVEKQYNTGPFISRKEYLIFKKIVTFEVMEYTEIE